MTMLVADSMPELPAASRKRTSSVLYWLGECLDVPDDGSWSVSALWSFRKMSTGTMLQSVLIRLLGTSASELFRM